MIINDYVIINLRLKEAGFQFYATNDGNTIIPIDDTNEISTSTPYTITGYMMGIRFSCPICITILHLL